jgi:uracil-DNA glycosylase
MPDATGISDGGPSILKTVDDLRKYLEHERDEGAAVVEADRAEVKRLSEISVMAAPGLTLEKIAANAAACKKCVLHSSRTRVVPGQGSRKPEIMFVGEAPGFDEDQQGLAFVGRAGQLLTKMIEAMGFTRDEVFIANILKCRPPDNRKPMPDEMAACLPFLLGQISILKPRVIVALGATAVKGLLDTDTGITRLRGTWMVFEGIPTMPTFHPAYLLRNPPAKKEAWADLQQVLKHIGRTPPPRKKTDIPD